MIIWGVDRAFIFSGPALDAALCLAMLAKHRLGEFPAVFWFVSLDLISGVTLYVVDPTGQSRAYVDMYALFDVLTSILQLLILVEIARNVLKPAGIWRREAFKPLFWIGSIGGAIALLAILFLEPKGLRGLASLQIRTEMFISLIACELVIAMMLSASEVGLPWKSHVMAVGQGFMLWSLVFASVEGVAAYVGPRSPFYNALFYARGAAYLLTIGYWTVSLWREEPARKPISPALRKYVVALHERVQYDLGKAGH